MQEIINKYETMVIFKGALSEEETTALTEKFKTLISENGEIKSVDVWGKRRFAYPINYQNDGFYLLIKFDSNPDFPKELDRIYRITEDVVRSLIVRREETEEAEAVKEEPKAVEVVAETVVEAVAEVVEEAAPEAEAVATEEVEVKDAE